MPLVSAKEVIVINSDNWMDIYSGAVYAALQDKDFKFLVSEKHSSMLVPFLKKYDTITVIESETLPFVLNYAETLNRQGIDATELKGSGRNLNLALAASANTDSFIIIDPSYGYDAISVAPYAVLTKSYVLFTDRKNIDGMLDLLETTGAGKIMLYGQVDKEVQDALSQYVPETINAGSRYDNNIEIVKRYRQISPTTQLTLSSGEIIEEGIFASKQPVLFIGKDIVPDSILNYVRSSGIEYGVLIGNELAKPAKQLKEAAGITVFIKFAQGNPVIGEDFSEVRGLDLFYLPSYDTKIELAGIRYNIATKTIDIALQNKKDLKTFLKTTVSVLSGEQRILAVGDKGIEAMEADDRIAFSYPADLTYEIAENKELAANIYSTYGEAPNFMDKELNEKATLAVVDKEDLCEMTIKEARFDTETQRLIITVKNNAPVDCYADASITGLIIQDEETTAGLDETALVEKGADAELRIKQRMDAVDLEDNKEVHARIYYGQDKSFLFKKAEGIFELRIEKKDYYKAILITLGIIAILIILSLVYRRFKKRE